MRFIVRWLFRLAIVALILLVALVLGKDLLLRELLQIHLQRETGLETRVGRFQLGLFSPTITIENLRLYNPPEFGGSIFLNVAECHLEYDGQALWERKLHLRLFRLNLAEATVVENAAGQSNLGFIANRLRQKQAAAPREDFAFGGLDTLNLSLGRLHRVKLTAPSQVQTLNLGVQNQVYSNLRTQQDVLRALASLALKVGLSQFTNQLAAPPGPGSTGAVLRAAPASPTSAPR